MAVKEVEIQLKLHLQPKYKMRGRPRGTTQTVSDVILKKEEDKSMS